MYRERIETMKHIRDVISEDEFNELINRCQAAASAQGLVFRFDEVPSMMGERQQAVYLRDLAHSVHMNDLASRLEPDEFPPSAFDTF